MASFEYVAASLKSLSAEVINAEYRLVRIRGIPQNPTFNVSQFEDIIDNFQTSDRDVFVTTYVKAGTTWTQQIIHQLLRQGEPGGFYGNSVPWLEATCSEMLSPREAPTWTLESINADRDIKPRYFKTHATVAHLPRGSGKIKVIYVARNPKDSVVSLYHHARSKPEFGYTGDFDTFCKLFLRGDAENGDWFAHVLDWYKKCQAEPEQHLFLRYEDMCRDNAGAIRKIARFLELPLSEEVLGRVVANSSISEMRQSSSIGLNHLRQGGYGGWRNMFSVSMSEFFDDVYRMRMRGSGLTFDFGTNSHGEDVVM